MARERVWRSGTARYHPAAPNALLGPLSRAFWTPQERFCGALEDLRRKNLHVRKRINEKDPNGKTLNRRAALEAEEFENGERVRIVRFDLNLGSRRSYPSLLGEEGFVDNPAYDRQRRQKIHGVPAILVRPDRLKGIGTWLHPDEIEKVPGPGGRRVANTLG